MIFEIAITQTPTVLEAQAGAQEKSVLPYTEVVGAQQPAALVRLGVEHAEELKKYLDHADQWAVRIRAS